MLHFVIEIKNLISKTRYKESQEYLLNIYITNILVNVVMIIFDQGTRSVGGDIAS